MPKSEIWAEPTRRFETKLLRKLRRDALPTAELEVEMIVHGSIDAITSAEADRKAAEAVAVPAPRYRDLFDDDDAETVIVEPALQIVPASSLTALPAAAETVPSTAFEPALEAALGVDTAVPDPATPAPAIVSDPASPDPATEETTTRLVVSVEDLETTRRHVEEPAELACASDEVVTEPATTTAPVRVTVRTRMASLRPEPATRPQAVYPTFPQRSRRAIAIGLAVAVVAIASVVLALI